MNCVTRISRSLFLPRSTQVRLSLPTSPSRASTISRAILGSTPRSTSSRVRISTWKAISSSTSWVMSTRQSHDRRDRFIETLCSSVFRVPCSTFVFEVPVQRSGVLSSRFARTPNLEPRTPNWNSEHELGTRNMEPGTALVISKCDNRIDADRANRRHCHRNRSGHDQHSGDGHECRKIQ